MSLISEFFRNEFNEYVRSVLHQELSARRHVELTFNVFDVVLDPDCEVATVQDVLDPARTESIGLAEFARMIEERTEG